MAEHSIRFGVTDNVRRGATWKIWSPREKADIYLVCRELKGAIKTSLHASGSWHSGYTNEALAKYFEQEAVFEQKKYIDMWPRPKEIVEGVTLAFRILTPHSSVTTPIETGLKNINWVPNCASGKSTQIDILITRNYKDPDAWPGKNRMKTHFVGAYELDNGETVWVVSWEIPTPNIPKLRVADMKYVKGRSIEDLKCESLKAIIFFDESDGTRTLVDCSINVNIN